MEEEEEEEMLTAEIMEWLLTLLFLLNCCCWNPSVSLNELFVRLAILIKAPLATINANEIVVIVFINFIKYL